MIDLKRTFADGEKEEALEVEVEQQGKDRSERTKTSFFLIKASEETANTTLLVVKGGALVEAVVPAVLKSTGSKKKALLAPSDAAQDAASLRTAREDAIEEWLKV